MSIIVLRNAYVWCGEQRCIGVLGYDTGTASVMGGEGWFDVLLMECLSGPPEVK